MSEASALLVLDLVAGYSAEVDILKGVSIELARQEIVTVVGPNGAGKSTLMKAIFGLIAPKSGRLLLAGESIAGLRPSAVARRGVVMGVRLLAAHRVIRVKQPRLPREPPPWLWQVRL